MGGQNAAPALSPLAQRMLKALAQEQARTGQAVPLVRIAKHLDAAASSLLRELAMLNLLLEQAQQPAWVQAQAVEGRWMLALTAAGAAAAAQTSEA
ncbi:hypothetical protein [Comamonas sp. B-9]|uniref:hypothetical protein n=1 Tax=Comamonas sp. B-9 TaxID=1055192 RepID=UPI00039578C9|nr:hypothetical protein [Comamonas sp. B-9]